MPTKGLVGRVASKSRTLRKSNMRKLRREAVKSIEFHVGTSPWIEDGETELKSILDTVDSAKGTDLQKLAALRRLAKNRELVSYPSVFKHIAKHEVPAKDIPRFAARYLNMLSYYGDTNARLQTIPKARPIGRHKFLAGMPREPSGLSALDGLPAHLDALFEKHKADAKVRQKKAAEKEARAAKAELKKKGRAIRKKAGEARHSYMIGDYLAPGNLWLFHKTAYLPSEKGVIHPTSYHAGKDECFRDTIHFAINSIVTSHMGGDWRGKGIVVAAPYEGVKDWIHTAHAVDTFGLGPLRLPEGTKIFMSKGAAESQGVRNGDKRGKAEVVVLDTEDPKLQRYRYMYEDKEPLDAAIYEHMKENKVPMGNAGAQYWISPSGDVHHNNPPGLARKLAGDGIRSQERHPHTYLAALENGGFERDRAPLKAAQKNVQDIADAAKRRARNAYQRDIIQRLADRVKKYLVKYYAERESEKLAA